MWPLSYGAAMHVVVAAVGADRPGIVAAVAKVLFDHGANIEDSRSAILGGHFAMVLMVALPPNANPDDLQAAFAAPAGDLGLWVSVRPVAEIPSEHAEGDGYMVSVYGADQPGIVYRVSAFLAEHNINIWDLATHIIEGDPPVYVMILEVAAPAGTDGAALESALKDLGSSLGVDVSLQPMEPETL